MNSIMVKTPHDSSFSISKRFFRLKSKVNDEEEILTFEGNSSKACVKEEVELNLPSTSGSKKNRPNSVFSKLRSALAIFTVKRSSSGLGTKVIGTFFGYKRGHVHFAIQENSKSTPVFIIELTMPTSVLVREMASGLVRIALECEKKVVKNKKGAKLTEEALWGTYCNGKKSGYAMRRDCGAEEWKILKAVEPVSMGAGVLPDGNGDDGSEGEVMYMRAKFERVVGSPDSEAFYMMNPDGGAGPELSFYLLRV